ncbi:uncharacterized protein EDB93DRAFT_1243283 [Suillus bovinus]|uniref:uncharacterized protein n=1 Tax=Suillus bovinus TaxID=48563 RepID=UPI001B879230|nr:uncharacterized protein EDB93DRAFT_1243283 [Suillus bovinus]KAG2130414.1 hypothetical protein EDB93DRAFT_1243283 [Suillus bovinus]
MNKRGLTHVRIGHAGAPQTHQKRSSCATGGFYISPSQGQTVSSSSPFNITWDTSCLSNTQAVDIYLIAPSLKNSRIHEWQNVNYALGTYQSSLETKWWNDTSTINLQLSIVTSNTQPFLSPFPAGPVFTATYTAPSDGSTPASADLSSPNGVTYVGNFSSSSSSSSGKIAAGVLVPLIFIGLGLAVYFKLSRAKSKEKSRRFSEAIDKRMSTISVDWKSMSAAGASAAIRHSMTVSGGGNRNSSFSFGPIRPLSTAAVEGDPSISDKASFDAPRMSQLRSGLRSQTTLGERVSRVSFATDIRPSMESRRTVGTSRAFHTGFEDTGDLSPTQTKGPFTLTPDDIRARMSLSGAPEARPSMDEVWPSLSMMRTGNEAGGDDYLLPQEQQSVDMPLPPVPVHPAPESGLGMMPMPANVMSPDEMLRAYAERKMKSPPPTGSLAFPIPAASYNGSGMRTLYTPSLSTQEGGEPNNRYTQAYDDPYAGTAT